MAQEPKNKQPDQPPPRRNWVEAASLSAHSAAREAFSRAGFMDATLVLRWDEFAGPEVARLARPLKLSGGAQGATLTLKCEPGAALFLQHESRALTGRINGYLGTDSVNRIRFVQGPLAARPILAPIFRRSGEPPAGDPARTYSGPEGLKAALLALAGRRARGR